MSSTGNVAYYHTDHLGTIRAISDELSAISQSDVYTSFGERITNHESPVTRYGFIGEFGYESFSGLTTNDEGLMTAFLHVGARTYDPAIGRFLQRDPIGIKGEINVYEYVTSSPVLWIDPEGLAPSLGFLGKMLDGIAGKMKPVIRGPGGKFARNWWRWGIKGTGRTLGVCGLIWGAWDFGYWTGTKVVQKTGIDKPIGDFLYRAGKAYNEEIKFREDFYRAHPSIPRVWCFVEGTQIVTTNGSMNIENVNIGDQILCQGTDVPTRDVGIITHKYERLTSDIVEIFIDDEVIRCTAEHPFWVTDRGWIKACDLNAYDDLINDVGETVIVHGIYFGRVCEPVKVYNITVSNKNTYFVGRSHILVHNKKP